MIIVSTETILYNLIFNYFKTESYYYVMPLKLIQTTLYSAEAILQKKKKRDETSIEFNLGLR